MITATRKYREWYRELPTELQMVIDITIISNTLMVMVCLWVWIVRWLFI